MKREVEYPLFQWRPKSGLFVFTSPTTMYRVLNIGSNTNAGVTIDHYITRKMVLSHMGDWDADISEEKFIALYNKIFQDHLIQMLAPIPQYTNRKHTPRQNPTTIAAVLRADGTRILQATAGKGTIGTRTIYKTVKKSMEPSKEQIARINQLHEEAMDLSEHADFKVRTAKKLYAQAYAKEREAADLIPEKGENIEPTRSTLYRGAMTLAVEAGLKAEAVQIANKLIEINRYAEYTQEANEVLAKYGVDQNDGATLQDNKI